MSGFGSKVESIWRENRLFTVLLELTYRCNLDCFFCYNDVSLKGTPLATEQYFALLDELAELGTLQLSLSGGEPLAHPDFFNIGARARELGFVVRIKSNGHALRYVLARRVRHEIDPYAIEVSLHGARAETHDSQTRVPGSFTRLVENLGGLAEHGLRVKTCQLPGHLGEVVGQTGQRRYLDTARQTSSVARELDTVDRRRHRLIGLLGCLEHHKR